MKNSAKFPFCDLIPFFKYREIIFNLVNINANAIVHNWKETFRGRNENLISLKSESLLFFVVYIDYFIIDFLDLIFFF